MNCNAKKMTRILPLFIYRFSQQRKIFSLSESALGSVGKIALLYWIRCALFHLTRSMVHLPGTCLKLISRLMAVPTDAEYSRKEYYARQNNKTRMFYYCELSDPRRHAIYSLRVRNNQLTQLAFVPS